MDWTTGDIALIRYVEERQAAALRAYEANPDLLEEHVGQEDSFRTGGYGQRQVSELLQNSVDALTDAGKGGNVEFRIADGALYCANQGSSFNEKGIRSVCMAFLSSKRDEDSIGRFGLGFKSVLGVTDNPQIYSQSVSFEFNGAGASELFTGMQTPDGRLPLMRVPSVIDASDAASQDAHLAELMTWATTIIKLPLTRGQGKRVREELESFKSETLLFMKSVRQFNVALQSKDGTIAVKSHRRDGELGAGQVTLHSPDRDPKIWLYAERNYLPDEQVLKTLTAVLARKSMTVSYAVPLDGQSQLGEIWAWFPLQDQTTARGIFNAPWQVNDDRTTLIPTSALNGAMLEVCADLFLDVVARASKPEDPAAHLDLFPARGRELRSAADGVLTAQIPRRARLRELIPDAEGVLHDRSHFAGVPRLDSPVPVETVRKWLAVVRRTSMPHPSAFARGNDRYTRLRSLLRDVDGQPSPIEQTTTEWLEELAKVRTVEATKAVCEVYIALMDAGYTAQSIGHAKIIPTSSGSWASPNEAHSVLIPRANEPVPEGVNVIDVSVIDPTVILLLRTIGLGEVSADQTAAALASTASERWTAAEWERLWNALMPATPARAAAVLAEVRERGVNVPVRTRAGRWRPADQVLVDDGIASALDDRHVGPLHRGRADLLRAAGCIEHPVPDSAVWNEPIYKEFAVYAVAAGTAAAKANGLSTHGISCPDLTAAGPLQLFIELGDDKRALAQWTEATLRVMRSTTVPMELRVSAKQKAIIDILAPDWWAVRTYGRVSTTLGSVRVGTAVGGSLRAYGAFLPVITSDLGAQIDAPRTVELVSDAALNGFLKRAAYDITPADVPRLTEIVAIVADRDSLGEPDAIPAVTRDRVVLRAPTDVVLATSPDDIALLEEHGLAYLDGTVAEARVLIERWGMRTSDEAMARSLEVRQTGPDVPLSDRFPSLAQKVSLTISRIFLRTSPGIIRRSETANGTIEKREMSARLDDVIAIDDSLDDIGVLEQVSRRLGLGLTSSDILSVLNDDDAMRRNQLIGEVRNAVDDVARLLLLFGAATLKAALPKGLLSAVEAKGGRQSDRQIAELYSRVRGYESLSTLREELKSLHLPVPAAWAGSDQAQTFVTNLGFSTGYAGTREVTPPALLQVQGRVELKPLHGFQETLADKIRGLALTKSAKGEFQRGLLFLPTGAGKTRVTVEAIVRMLESNELTGPVLWIAQSQELCEQAVQTWTDVWRAIGDERVMDISRFWGNYELDESGEELQIVVATDDKIYSRIKSDERAYPWLANSALVVIDEAHTAGTMTYTNILRWLGLTAAKTERPLLGLTATPYRGRNEELNRLFALRFGNNKLESLDPEDPIGELRREEVLADVDHYVLGGSVVSVVGNEAAEFVRLKEVSKSMLDRIGQDTERTQTLVDDILEQDPTWPVLVFAASVASAHTIAALLTLEGKKAAAVDGSMRPQERRRLIEEFRSGTLQILVNCDLLTQGFDAPKVRALYIARPTFSPNRYHQMIGRGLRGPKNGGKERCLIVNVADTFEEFGEQLAFTEFNYLWDGTK